MPVRRRPVGVLLDPVFGNARHYRDTRGGGDFAAARPSGDVGSSASLTSGATTSRTRA
jgi:hypothetical protein